MVVAARPDLIYAVVGKLLAETDLTALTSTRISGAVQDAWNPMPRHAVLVRQAGGGPGKRQINFMETRLDVFCYGSTALEAMRVWRQLDAVFCPGQERQVSFERSGCRVYSVDPERMATSETEADSGWPRVSATYLVRWMGIATS